MTDKLMKPAHKQLVPQMPLFVGEVNHIAISMMLFVLSCGPVVDLSRLQMRRNLRKRSKMNSISGTGITVSSMTYLTPAMVIISQYSPLCL